VDPSGVLSKRGSSYESLNHIYLPLLREFEEVGVLTLCSQGSVPPVEDTGVPELGDEFPTHIEINSEADIGILLQ